MIIKDLMYVLIVQITLLLVLLIILSVYLIGREGGFKFLTKILLGLFTGFILSVCYVFSITNELYLFVIIFCLLTFYTSGYSGFACFFALLVVKSALGEIDYSLVIAFSAVILTVISKRFVKNLKKMHFIMFIIGIVLINLEFMLNKNQDYVVINLFAWVFFCNLLYFVYKIKLNYQNLYERKKQFYYDHISDVRNYYCLIDHSARILNKKNRNISIILVHLNDLRDINNLYGLYFGNKIIKLVADQIKLNSHDFGDVYRIDGDTFCIVSHEKFKVIKTICDRIKHEIDIKEVIIDNNKISPSVTIGAYCGLINSKNIDDYIELSQDSLYQAKSVGGNKVIIQNQD